MSYLKEISGITNIIETKTELLCVFELFSWQIHIQQTPMASIVLATCATTAFHDKY